ncbi:hypothetical protein WJX81_003194 [Elliptochloris bilobata]|uniref:Ribosome biogenesis protein NOP53 n=1 Tax=Elliptochloris bilobata TaxID=381761 RepID=A0AAW1RZG6_9CHLO
MGKGMSQRKRAANFLKAKKESGKISSLPPPPEEVGGKRKRRGQQDDMPSSLRQMLELKAKLEGQQRKRPKLAAESMAGCGALCGAVDPTEGARQSRKGGRASAGRESALAQGISGDGLGVELGSGQESWRPDGGGAAPEAAFVQKRGLKQRKKDFLNRRKLKKRGLSVSAAVEGDRLERRLLQDPHRPAFGEQALAPLKVNLKRKHWGAASSDAQSAGQRCREVFQRQLAIVSAGHPAGGGVGAAASKPGASAARGRQGRGFQALQARRKAAAAVAAQSMLRDSMSA